MPLQKEFEIVDKLNFIPEPTNRLIIAQKITNTPRRPTLDWFIELFNNCRDNRGWLDATQMQGLIEGDFIPGRARKTAENYVKKTARYGEYATPQLGLCGVPVGLMHTILVPPFRLWSVGAVEDLLAPEGSWSSVFNREKRSRLLQTQYSENGNGLLIAGEIFKTALSEYRNRRVA